MLGIRSQRLAVTVAALLPALALAACGSSGGGSGANGAPGSQGANGATFKIALLADMSGVGATNAKPGVSGVRAAIGKINDGGGVLGKKLDLEVIDAQSSADTALNGAQKAIADNPLAVIMFSTSAEGAKVTPVLLAAHLPFLSSALPDSSLYPPQPTLFMPSVTAHQSASAIVEFAKQKAGGSFNNSVIDIAAINSPYVDTVIGAMTPRIKDAGGKVTRVERYDYGIASFAAQAGKIQGDKPTIVFTLGASNDTITVSKALTASGVSALQIGFGSNAAEPVFQAVKTSKYWAPTENVFPSKNPEFLAAAQKAGVKDGVLGSTYSNAGWIATYLVSEGLSKCGTGCDYVKLPTALEQINNYTVPGGVSYGPISLSSSNHSSASEMKFHNYDPGTGQWSESDPISVVGK